MRKRDQRARIHFTEKEKEDVRCRAQEAGLDMSKYLRGRLNSVEVIPAPQVDFYDYARRFRSIGGTINEIVARGYTQGFIDVPGVHAALANLTALEEALKNELTEKVSEIRKEYDNESR